MPLDGSTSARKGRTRTAQTMSCGRLDDGVDEKLGHMTRTNLIVGSLIDLGAAAAWFGGLMMGATAVNPAGADVSDPVDRGMSRDSRPECLARSQSGTGGIRRWHLLTPRNTCSGGMQASKMTGEREQPGSNVEFNVGGHGISPRAPTRARPRAVEIGRSRRWRRRGYGTRRRPHVGSDDDPGRIDDVLQ